MSEHVYHPSDRLLEAYRDQFCDINYIYKCVDCGGKARYRRRTDKPKRCVDCTHKYQYKQMQKKSVDTFIKKIHNICNRKCFGCPFLDTYAEYGDGETNFCRLENIK